MRPKGPLRIQRQCAGLGCLKLVSGGKFCLACREKRNRQQLKARRSR